MTTVTQKSFAGGIMGPMMLGRSDDTKYQAGLKECKNFICLPQGAVQNRAGFEYVSECKFANKPVRLIPFVFSRTQTMVLEFGDKYVRFHTDGKTLLNADGTAPYEITSPYAAEDVMDLHFAQDADILSIVHHNYPPTDLKRYSLRDWRFETVNFNSTLPAPTGVSAVKASAAENEINADKYQFKYCVTALNLDRTVQSSRSEIAGCVANIYNTGTTIRISWNAVEGASWYRIFRNTGGIYAYIGETDELSIIDDNIKPDADYTPPRRDEIFSASGGITSVTVTNAGNGYSTLEKGVVSVDALLYLYNYNGHNDPILTARVYDEGGQGTGATATVQYTYNQWDVEVEAGGDSGHTYTQTRSSITITGINITNPGSGYVKPMVEVTDTRGLLKYYGTLYTHLTALSNGWSTIYKNNKTYLYHSLSTKTEVPTAYITDSTGRGAELAISVANGKVTGIRVVRPGSGYTNPVVHIDSVVGAGATATATAHTAADYPQCVAYFEQRRVFASTPLKPQAIWMSRTGTDSDFSYSIPVRSDDRINFKIASLERHEIYHLVPLNRLMVLTEAGEWAVASVNSDSITPTSIQLKSQSFVGSTMVRPLVINNTILYAAARGGHIRELGYNYSAGGYVTGDVSIRCSHLFDSYEIVDSAFSRAPYPIAWFTSTSGDLLGMTYVPDQNVTAWHRHTTKKGFFESVASVSEGDMDAVYCVVVRQIGTTTKRFIERMAKRETVKDADAFFVDAGFKYDGEETDAITGLTWLEGEEVCILADGSEVPRQTVTDGKITLPVKAKKVAVGLPIEAVITTLPASVAVRDGTDAGPRQKNVSSVFMRVYRSSGIFVGPEDGDLVEFRQRTTEAPGTPPEPVTGGIDIPVKPNWDDSGSVTVRQDSPLPLTILTISSEISLGGRG